MWVCGAHSPKIRAIMITIIRNANKSKIKHNFIKKCFVKFAFHSWGCFFLLFMYDVCIIKKIQNAQKFSKGCERKTYVWQSISNSGTYP